MMHIQQFHLVASFVRSGRATMRHAVVVACLALLLSACNDPNKNKAAYLAKGQAYLKAQQFAEARIEFRNALQIDRNLADAHYGLAEASFAVGYLQEAAEQYQLAAKLDQNNLPARVRLGNIFLQYTRIGKERDEGIREAERLAGEVLAKEPNHSEAIILLAEVRSLQRRYEDAQAELDRAIRLNPDRIEPQLALARFYERRANELSGGETTAYKTKAEAAFQLAISKNPQSASARLAYGDFLYANNRGPAVEEQLLQAFKNDPRDKLTLVALQHYYENLYRYDEAEKYLRKQIEIEPDKIAGQAQVIDLHARAGQPAQAIQEYQQLLKEHPDFQRGYARLAELLLAAGKPNEAKAQIQLALKRNAQDTDSLLVRGRIRTLEGDYRDGLIDLEQALRMEPAMPAALFYTADAHLQNNDPTRARSLINTLLGYYPRHPMGSLMLVRIHLHQERPQDAINAAEQMLNTLAVLKTNFNDFQATRLPLEAMKDLESKAYTARAVAKMQVRDFGAAQTDLQRAASIDQTATEPHINLATIHLQNRNLAAAQTEAEKAVALAPNSPNAVAILIDIYLGQRNHSAAQAKLDALLSAQEDKAPLLFQKARVADAQGDLNATEKALRDALAADPDYLNALFALSDFYQRNKLTDRAISELTAIVSSKRQTQQTAQAHLLLGLLEEDRSRYFEAIANYEKAVGYDSRSLGAAIAYNNLAWLFADRNLGNLDKAADHAQHAISISPEANFYDTLGYAYYRKRQFAIAVEQFNRAIERNPSKASYHLHLARALRDNNAIPQARAAYAKVLQLGNVSSAEVSQARQEMTALPRV